MKHQILIKHERSSNHWSWCHNQVFTTRLYDLYCGLMQNPGTIIDSIRSRNACDAQLYFYSCSLLALWDTVTGFPQQPPTPHHHSSVYYFHVCRFCVTTKFVFTYCAGSNPLYVRQNSLLYWNALCIIKALLWV